MKEEKILILVESPNKIATIKNLLKDTPYKEATIMASVGHISYIKDGGKFYNMGIDPTHDFEANYQVMPDKKDVVEKLKDQVKISDKIYIASDGDREGEAIAWSLQKFLKIPENKYERITFHEITKNAILNAIDNSRKIDNNLVEAAQTRQKLDKIVGYRLSPIARKSISAKSVGRCQSAGLKLIVQKEKEINNFKSEKYFELYLLFRKHSTDFKAKYVGTNEKEIKSFSSFEECRKIISQCYPYPYIVKNIENKKLLDYPKPPFSTSTFQQEVSKQLGISIKDSMSYAQKLFEGISINGQHIALITYIRTDCTDMAPEFLNSLKDYIKEQYGENYYSPIKEIKQKDGVQAGHEAIRPVDLNMTPQLLAKYVDDNKLLKIYDIIYRRVVSSSMKPSIISNTQYSIYNLKNKFVLNSKEMIFDGYKKVYNYQEEDLDKDPIIKETFDKEEELKKTVLKYIEKETQPPKRYNEASFIKELDKSGIGRPSTYATIVETLLSEGRGYCTLKDKIITPTIKGIRLCDFLDQFFPDIVNIKYTSNLEKKLDGIAEGKIKEKDFLSSFYSELEESIHEWPDVGTKWVKINENTVMPVDDQVRICPKCHRPLVYRRGKYGDFYGCSGYPSCTYTEKI